jgi:hypothetical protein
MLLQWIPYGGCGVGIERARRQAGEFVLLRSSRAPGGSEMGQVQSEAKDFTITMPSTAMASTPAMWPQRVVPEAVQPCPD